MGHKIPNRSAIFLAAEIISKKSAGIPIVPSHFSTKPDFSDKQPTSASRLLDEARATDSAKKSEPERTYLFMGWRQSHLATPEQILTTMPR